MWYDIWYLFTAIDFPNGGSGAEDLFRRTKLVGSYVTVAEALNLVRVWYDVLHLTAIGLTLGGSNYILITNFDVLIIIYS